MIFLCVTLGAMVLPQEFDCRLQRGRCVSSSALLPLRGVGAREHGV